MKNRINEEAPAFDWDSKNERFIMPESEKSLLPEIYFIQVSCLVHILSTLTGLAPEVILKKSGDKRPKNPLIRYARRVLTVILRRAWPEEDKSLVGRFLDEPPKKIRGIVIIHKAFKGNVSEDGYYKLCDEAEKRFLEAFPSISLSEPLSQKTLILEENEKKTHQLKVAFKQLVLPKDSDFLFANVLSFEKFCELLFIAIEQKLHVSKVEMQSKEGTRRIVGARCVFCAIVLAVQFEEVDCAEIGKQIRKECSQVDYYSSVHQDLIKAKDKPYTLDFCLVWDTVSNSAKDFIPLLKTA